MKIEIISGSPRHESVTVRVAKFLHKFLSETTTHEVNFHFLQFRKYGLRSKQFPKNGNIWEKEYFLLMLLFWLHPNLTEVIRLR